MGTIRRISQTKSPARWPGHSDETLDKFIVSLHRAGRKGVMRPNFDPTKLVDEWPLPGLSTTDRMRITAELFSADSDFKALDFQGEDYPYVKPMQDAFTGIASILFDGHMLTVAVLENELRLFVIESAVAGNWVSFPENHFDKYRREHFIKHKIFAAHIAKWKSKLLKRQADKIQVGPGLIEQPNIGAEQTRRANLLAEYKAATRNPSNRQIYGARNSGIHKPEFHAWLKGTLSSDSETTRNFERFLREKKLPIPRKAKG